MPYLFISLFFNAFLAILVIFRLNHKFPADFLETQIGKLRNLLAGSNTDVSRIEFICNFVGGGVYKRIDENRELLELLQSESPDFLAKNPWVISWLKSNDDFFAELERVVKKKDGQFYFLAKTSTTGPNQFPRKWPVKSTTTP